MKNNWSKNHYTETSFLFYSIAKRLRWSVRHGRESERLNVLKYLSSLSVTVEGRVIYASVVYNRICKTAIGSKNRTVAIAEKKINENYKDIGRVNNNIDTVGLNLLYIIYLFFFTVKLKFVTFRKKKRK